MTTKPRGAPADPKRGRPVAVKPDAVREAEPGGADGGPAAVPDKEPETIRPPLDDLESGPRSLAPVAARPEPASPAASSPRPVPPRPRPDPRAAATDPADIPLEEQTAEMRWPPGSWVRVTNIVRHSTSEPIEGIAVGDVAQVTAALSQTLVLIFPTRDNRREVLHIESIETVEAPPPPLARGRRR